jgi:hypothetical protein
MIFVWETTRKCRECGRDILPSDIRSYDYYHEKCKEEKIRA